MDFFKLQVASRVKVAFYPILIFFIWRMGILLYQVFLQPYYVVTPESATIHQRIFLSWATYWDAGHYLSIAQNGYVFPQQAFFPLWPLSIKLVTFAGVSGEVASFLLTFLFGLTTFVLFYILASRLIGFSHAKSALLVFATFPSAMFLLAGYTETLFLTLVLLSFLLLENKKYFLASVLGGLASMTRLVGVALTLPFVFAHAAWPKRFAYFLIVLSGIALYMLYLQFQFGDFLYFLKAQKAWCEVAGRCQLTFPLAPLFDYATQLLSGRVKPSLYPDFIDWSLSVLFLGLLVPTLRRLGPVYFAYGLSVLLLPLLSGTSIAMSRYVLVAFPVFFVMPLLLRSKISAAAVCGFLFFLQIRFITLFTNRLFVA